jgi:hypothetical protein
VSSVRSACVYLVEDMAHNTEEDRMTARQILSTFPEPTRLGGEDRRRSTSHL